MLLRGGGQIDDGGDALHRLSPHRGLVSGARVDRAPQIDRAAFDGDLHPLRQSPTFASARDRSLHLALQALLVELHGASANLAHHVVDGARQPAADGRRDPLLGANPELGEAALDHVPAAPVVEEEADADGSPQ